MVVEADNNGTTTPPQCEEGAAKSKDVIAISENYEKLEEMKKEPANE